MAFRAWVEEKRPVITYGHIASFAGDEHIPVQLWDLLKNIKLYNVKSYNL